MSARFQLRPRGVFDTVNGAELPPEDPGYALIYLPWLAAGNRPDPQPVPPLVLTLDQAVALRTADIEAKAAEQRERVTGAVTPQEMASWGQKLAQAQAFKAAPVDDSAPMLAIEAQVRGVPTADIVRRVLANATAYMRAESAIAGAAGRHRDAIRALADVDAVLGYDFTAGWPFGPPAASAPPL